MNSTNSNLNQTHKQIVKVNRANQITTYREPTAWIEISEDQLPEDLRTDDNEPKVIEFCKIIKERGSDNLTILKEQLLNINGSPNSILPPTAHRCIFWKEIDLSPQVSQNTIKEHYTVINTMDPNDDDLTIESCEEIHKQYVQKLEKCSVDAQVACAMSQEFLKLLKHIIEQGPKDQNQCKQNQEPRNIETKADTQTTSYRTYKYEQDFGRVIEAYPMSFEWFPKKTDESKNPPNLNKDTTKDTVLENMNNENIPLGSAHSTTVHNVCHHKKLPPCTPPPPPCPPPKCPPPPPGPPQSCDPENVNIKCSAGEINFKLKCKKLPIDCQNKDVRYECELIDEGKCIDSTILESCNLKCERVEAIHNDPRMVYDVLEDAEGPIIVKEIDDKKEDDTPEKKVSTMVCAKDGVNFNLKCTRTTPDPDFPSDIRFICELGKEYSEENVSSADIMSIPIRCKQVCNAIDDSVIGDENCNQNLKNEDETERNESFIQCLEERDKRSKHKTDVKEKKKIYACRSKPKIDKEEFECDKSDSDESEDFVDPNQNVEPEYCEQPTSLEHLKCAFLQNHNKTMNILKAATNDLLCTITDATREVYEDRANKTSINTNIDTFECVNAAKESCEKLIETVCQGTRELRRLNIETLDSLAYQSKKYICSEKEYRTEKLSNLKLRKISGKKSTDDSITAISQSVKYINNDMTNKDLLDHNQPQQKDDLERDKPSPVSTEEKPGIVKTMTTVKKSCEGLYDKMCKSTQQLSVNTSKAYNDVTSKSMKWFDSPGGNELSTGHKNMKKVISGLTVFQGEEKTEPEEENLPSRNWTDSIHFALTSLGDTLKDIRPDNSEKSSPYDKPSPPRQMKYDIDNEEATPISSMFATLKEKICSMFYDHNDSESTTSSSSFSDVSDLNDDNHMD